ncbi:MAG: metal-dependent transcriptional regulator [Clostridia bacterium]|nr:metal-dependent transcriptional regulator [Clostridia bacterium]
MTLHRSGTRYLKSIYLLHQRSERVRKCDIAKELGYSKASVSSMIGRLCAQGYVYVLNHDVCLTRDGLRCARELCGKCGAIRDFWVEVLRIDGATARREAEQLAHVISADTLHALERELRERRPAKDDSPAGKMAD